MVFISEVNVTDKKTTTWKLNTKHFLQNTKLNTGEHSKGKNEKNKNNVFFHNML